MRKALFYFLNICLAALIVARALLPEPAQAQPAMASSHDYGYNILNLDLPISTQTAGSALIAEMNGYYLFRAPTEKNAYTGLLSGKNLILICADGWRPLSAADKTAAPALNRLWQEGARFSEVYRPDWYQGMDGREFALLSGVTPTNVNGETSLLWAGERDVYLPYTLARCLGGEGYACLAFGREEAHRAAYQVMDFSQVNIYTGTALEILEETMDGYTGGGPFFAYYVWEDADGEPALEYLLAELKKTGRAHDTAVCLLTGNSEDCRAQLFLWADGLAGAAVTDPCSELDVTPTLLNLFGIEYDSRFLSGRDVFARNAEPGTASAVTPLVSLYGSAYSDWVTDSGSYCAGDSVFFLTKNCFADSAAVTAYVTQVKQLVYDRYIFARRAMENNYFQIALGS